jgi:hypothetical protein
MSIVNMFSLRNPNKTNKTVANVNAAQPYRKQLLLDGNPGSALIHYVEESLGFRILWVEDSRLFSGARIVVRPYRINRRKNWKLNRPSNGSSDNDLDSFALCPR